MGERIVFSKNGAGNHISIWEKLTLTLTSHHTQSKLKMDHKAKCKSETEIFRRKQEKIVVVLGRCISSLGLP